MSVLKVENLGFSYDKNTSLIEDVSLAFESKERVAIDAPSGYGKSTLCQLMAGYLKPDSGRITLDDAPIANRPGAPNPVQLIWQHPEQALDPYTRLGKSLAEVGETPGDVIEGLGIREEWFTRFPHELSGGELQRFCIARTLTVKPKFIIADEISTMLDAITQVQVFEFLLEHCANNDTGLILVTHSPALRDRLATRTVFL